MLASGKLESLDLYTVVGLADLGRPITALKLEVLTDPSLPAKGPGRADNGNLVLTEFRVGTKPIDNPDAAFADQKLTNPTATFQQDGFPINFAIDGNRATGWALAPQLGRDHAAMFRFAKEIANGPVGVAFNVQLEQQFQAAANHTIGKFRLSVTSGAEPKIASPLSAEQLAILDTPEEKRTAAQKDRLRQMYVAPSVYQNLAAEAAKVHSADARVLGAQDLVWAPSTAQPSCSITRPSRAYPFRDTIPFSRSRWNGRQYAE